MDGWQKSVESPVKKRRHSDAEVGTLTTLSRGLLRNTNEFCDNTTLHGLKYVVDKQLYPLERIFFAASFIVVVVVSVFFISNVYAKWRSTPIILSLNPVPTVISKEPFPAVTICNLNQAVKRKVQHYDNTSIEFAMLKTICHREVNMTIAKTMSDWSMLEQFIVSISQPCTRLLMACRFGAIDYNCSDIFRPIVTDAGLCCVFNMVHPQFMYIPDVSNIQNISYSDGSVPVRWDPEHGYPVNLPPKFYPRTAAGTGENLGFSIILNVEADDYYCSSSNGVGFKIFLHSPTETPHVKEVGLFLAAGTEAKLRIQAEKFETDLKLRGMKKHYRQCLFNRESELEYFAHYTKRNCEMECITRMVIKHCGCVSHYMPKMYTNKSICGVQHMNCVAKYRRLSMLSDANVDDCHDLCWPSCFDLTFDPDVFTIPLSHKGFSVEHELVQNMTSTYLLKNVAMAHIYFKENTYRSSKQTEFIGSTDFLSSIGGLMGLFMGFSFISVAECLYYAFMRPYYNIRRNDNLILVKSESNKANDIAKRWPEVLTKFLQSTESERTNPSVSLAVAKNAVGHQYYGLDVNNWQTRSGKGLILPTYKH